MALTVRSPPEDICPREVTAWEALGPDEVIRTKLGSLVQNRERHSDPNADNLGARVGEVEPVCPSDEALKLLPFSRATAGLPYPSGLLTYNPGAMPGRAGDLPGDVILCLDGRCIGRNCPCLCHMKPPSHRARDRHNDSDWPAAVQGPRRDSGDRARAHPGTSDRRRPPREGLSIRCGRPRKYELKPAEVPALRTEGLSLSEIGRRLGGETPIHPAVIRRPQKAHRSSG